MMLAGILYFALFGYKLLPKNSGAASLEDDQFAVKDYSDVPKWKQYMSLAVLVIAILAMVFEKQIGIKLQVSASVGAIILILTGVISEKEALKSIDLKTVFLFGGSLALATALEHTGAGSLIADTLIGAMGNEVHPLILLVVIFVITCTMTNFMSNTATTALMVPIAVSLAQGLGRRPPRGGHCYGHCRQLCLRNADRYARQYNGCRHRRLQIYRLRQGRSAADPRQLYHLHGDPAGSVSVLPRMIS